MGVANRVVIVTGAAGALGASVAERLVADGATVAGLDIVSQSQDWWSAECDLTDAAACAGMIERIGSEVGPVWGLANIAGGFAFGERVHETSAESWDSLFDLNVSTALNMMRACVPGMIQAGAGKIVNIGARAALRGAGQMSTYCASKSVVMRLTESLADEVKGAGVNVNCILPSIIDTARNRADMPDADFDAWVAPAQIAAVVAFLMSDDAAAIHGACLPVEGLS